jgi:hypothetical protein
MESTPRASSEPVMAAEAVSVRMAPPSWTSFLRTTLLGTSRLKPAAFLASRRQPVSLVHPTWSGHVLKKYHVFFVTTLTATLKGQASG